MFPDYRDICMFNKQHVLCPGRQQRRATLQKAQTILAQAEDWLLLAVIFAVFLFPLLLNPSFVFNLSAYLWWIKGLAWIGLVAWFGLRLLIGLPLAPAQIAGATVEAMEQTAPEKQLVSLPVPVAVESFLIPWRQAPALIQQQVETQVQQVHQQLWRRRSHHRLLSGTLVRHVYPLSSRSPEPSI